MGIYAVWTHKQLDMLTAGQLQMCPLNYLCELVKSMPYLNPNAVRKAANVPYVSRLHMCPRQRG